MTSPESAHVDFRLRETFIQIRRQQFGSSRDRLVLLGAGASSEAGFPTGAELHQQLLPGLAVYRAVSDRLGPGNSYPDVERYFRLLEFLSDRDRDGSVSKDAAALLGSAQVATNLLDPAAARIEVGSIYAHLRRHLWRHANWLAGLTIRERRIEGADDPNGVNYLLPLVEQSVGGTIVTLNYDNAIELVGGANIHTVDNSGGNRVVVPKQDEHAVRLLKLHGSLDWMRNEDDVFRGQNPLGSMDYTPAIVFGSGNKLRHYGPFLDLMYEFKQVLARTRFLVTIGYSYRDPHVNEALRVWASAPPDSATKHVTVCLGPSERSLPRQVVDWMQHEHVKVHPLEPKTTEAFIRENFASLDDLAQ